MNVVELVRLLGVYHINVELVDVFVDPELQGLEEVECGYLQLYAYLLTHQIVKIDDSDDDFLVVVVT